MSDFHALIREAEVATIEGWDFGWLDGRAFEERPSWRFFDRVAERAATVDTLLELQAGTGAMIAALPRLPVLSVATEGFPPSVAVAVPLLRSLGVGLVVTSQSREALPFAAASFALVTSRHPIEPWWSEIARVLRPNGSYLAQHVGPGSLRSLTEFLMGPRPEGSRRHPDVERRAAEANGLVVNRMDVERPRTTFLDIGAVVYFLRLVPWIVPDFSVPRYADRLRDLDGVIQREGSFETTASRTLVEVSKPSDTVT